MTEEQFCQQLCGGLACQCAIGSGLVWFAFDTAFCSQGACAKVSIAHPHAQAMALTHVCVCVWTDCQSRALYSGSTPPNKRPAVGSSRARLGARWDEGGCATPLQNKPEANPIAKAAKERKAVEPPVVPSSPPSPPSVPFHSPAPEPRCTSNETVERRSENRPPNGAQAGSRGCLPLLPWGLWAEPPFAEGWWASTPPRSGGSEALKAERREEANTMLAWLKEADLAAW